MWKYIRSTTNTMKLSWMYILFVFLVPVFIFYNNKLTSHLRDDYIYFHRRLSNDLNQTQGKFGIKNLTSKWNFTKLSHNLATLQAITNDRQSFVFSAYVDDTKNQHKIRAIGVKERSYVNSTYCLIWYKTNDNSMLPMDTYAFVAVSGYINEHPEIFERSWSVVHYMCPIDDLPTDPFAVSIVTELNTEPLNMIPIIYSAEAPFYNYTICLHNAFNFRSDVSKEIVEWVEMNRILGAEHFVVYNYSSHPKNDEVLGFYKSQGIIELVQWDVPIYADLIFNGEVAVMTDCLFRNYYSAKYISHLDLDEYIVPRRPGVTTIPELISALPQYCGYIARCMVYAVDNKRNGTSPFIGEDQAEQFKLNTLLVRRRQDFIWDSKDRSKLILRPACIEAAGVHLINSFASDIVSETTFDVSDAVMHHYRKGKPVFIKKGGNVKDDFMLKFASALINNTAHTWNRLSHIMHL